MTGEKKITSFASFPINEIAKEETKNNHENIEITTIEAAPDMDWTAFNLCLFGGYLGLHRFYMGHNGIGALQLATLGGAGIWWISDLSKFKKHYPNWKLKYSLDMILDKIALNFQKN